ncbi:hypothetical protein DFH08DRAFT_800034 [Mycena albidolilacea]|uniref:Uncharacterized protein n=1 Tax=Mycena albidolilacea TaxID=1033008 RepID=A0AAD7AND1_9AGAR|nr:hypothetical protein DFH08DRAFT_800034 [Mycena albidolilacea]
MLLSQYGFLTWAKLVTNRLRRLSKLGKRWSRFRQGKTCRDVLNEAESIESTIFNIQCIPVYVHKREIVGARRLACNSAPEDGAEVYLDRLGCVAARRARGPPVVEGGIVNVVNWRWRGVVEGGVVDVVWTAGGVVEGGVVNVAAREVEIQGCGMVREVHKEGRGQTRTWFCAILTTVLSHPDEHGTWADVGKTLLLSCTCGSREEVGAGGFWAGDALRVDVHEVVVMEQGHFRYHRGTVWEKEGGHMFGARLSSASISSSAGKLSAGGGAFPKKDQGRRQFVSSAWARLHHYIFQQLLGSLGRLGYLQKADTQRSLNLKVLIEEL